MSTPSKPIRRLRLRFTLRLLLVAITAVCIGLAIWTHRAREQRRVVERIDRGGADYVLYDREFAQFPDAEGAIGQSLIPKFFVNKLGWDYFYHVRCANLTDRTLLPELGKLSGVETLYLSCEGLSNEDLETVASLPNLCVLSIFTNEPTIANVRTPSTQLNDQSLKIISRLSTLEVLYIADGGGFTAEGIAELSQARRLCSVYVGHCHESINASAAEPLKRTGKFESIEIQRWNRTLGEPETIVAWTRPPVAAPR